MSLTDTAIRNAKPKDKPYRLTDGKGLYLLVQPSGGKLWRFDYVFEGKRKTLALGGYPDVPLAGDWLDPKTKKIWIDGARDKHNNARKMLANDIDPSENKKATNESKSGALANSFEVVAREWLATKMQTKGERYQLKVLRRFDLYLFPWLGKRAISELNAPELLDVIKNRNSLQNITGNRASA